MLDSSYFVVYYLYVTCSISVFEGMGVIVILFCFVFMVMLLGNMKYRLCVTLMSHTNINDINQIILVCSIKWQFC